MYNYFICTKIPCNFPDASSLALACLEIYQLELKHENVLAKRVLKQGIKSDLLGSVTPKAVAS